MDDVTVIGRVLAGLIFVAALVGLAGLALKRYGVPGGKIKRESEARLSVVEALPLDQRTRLLIIQRDDVQHLVALGQDGIRVIETGFDAPENEMTFEGPSLSSEKPAKKHTLKMQDITEEVSRAADA